MDKVLKQRLVGASILIALAVIFLPMLFDGGTGETDDQREMALELPDQPSGERRVRRLALDPDAARQREPATEEAEATAQAAVSETPDRTRAQPPESPQPSSGSQAVADSGAAAESSETEAEETTGPEETAGEEADASTAGTDPAPAPDATTDPVEPSATEAGEASAAASSALDEGWSVQVAVFSSLDTAESILERLEGLGHEAWMDELVRDQAELYRLRTGPYSTRAAAQQALEQINTTIAGVNPELREPDGPAAGVETREGLSAQVGSFASRNNAERLSAQLRSAGFDAFMHGEESGGRTIWRVRVGIFAERSDAERMLETLRDEQGLDGIVVSHP